MADEKPIRPMDEFMMYMQQIGFAVKSKEPVGDITPEMLGNMAAWLLDLEQRVCALEGKPFIDPAVVAEMEQIAADHEARSGKSTATRRIDG